MKALGNGIVGVHGGYEVARNYLGALVDQLVESVLSVSACNYKS